MDIIDLFLTTFRYAPVALMIVAVMFLVYIQVREARMEKLQRYRRRY